MPGASHPPGELVSFGDAIAVSLSMRKVFDLLERVAPGNACVLLQGETGTGKGLLARATHAHSGRRNREFLVVDCSAINLALIESELFGQERGSSAGAAGPRQGAFELADQGTVFLDDVDELPLGVQPKLMQVLESGEYRRVGSNKVLKTEARVIAATKRSLKEEVERGKFREDLYSRLSVVPVEVVPLRHRREDIPALAESFVEQGRRRTPSTVKLTLSRETLAALSAHDWPGNVRELRNVLDRTLQVAQASGERELCSSDIPLWPSPHGAPRPPQPGFEPSKSYREVRSDFEADFERRYVSWLLDRHSGNISAAAREAKMDRKHLYDLARKHGLRANRG